MLKTVTPTQLRAHLFQILDEVLETGEPCEISRGGRRLLLVAAGPPRRNFADLPKRKCYLGSADELVATTWDYEPDEGLSVRQTRNVER